MAVSELRVSRSPAERHARAVPCIGHRPPHVVLAAVVLGLGVRRPLSLAGACASQYSRVIFQ